MPALQRAAADWADDEELDDPNALPAQQILTNNDGTKTIITYRFNDDGKKIKTTRRIRTTVVKEHVNPRVAERKEWAKFGKEKGNAKGPDVSTTTIGENMLFKPNVNYKVNQKEDVSESQNMKDKLKDKKVACRICKGDHFTARCPYKDTLPPMDEVTAAAAAGDEAGGNEASGLGDGEGGTRYIAPHLRKGAGDKAGDKLGGGAGGGGSGNFRDRDDLATLRVTNISELCEEQDLWNMFERFGKVIRVFLAKDRDTGRSKGFAFISYVDQADAQKACEKMDGHGFGHLILRVEFAKRT